MALSSDDLRRIQQAAALGTDPNELNMELTDEVAETYRTVLDEINAFEGKTMIEPVFDWPDDTYDELIAATEAKHGKPRTLAEMEAEDATLVSKSVDERMFTLGPMYIPYVRDAHNEWTGVSGCSMTGIVSRVSLWRSWRGRMRLRFRS
jgi:hypothetical protein